MSTVPQDRRPTLDYESMTWDMIQEAAEGNTPLLLPVGSTEQHGLHLPVSTDWMLPKHVLSVAAKHRRFVIGPAIPFGYRSRPGSGGGQNFPGTLSLRAATFISMIQDVLSELVRTGFQRILIYNWHLENANLLYEPAFLVSESHPDVHIVLVEDALPELPRDDQEQIWPDGFPGTALEHAGIIETSLWMNYRPDAVRTHMMRPDTPEKIVQYDVLPIDAKMSTASGSLASPVESSAEKGKLLLRHTVDHLLGIFDQEFGDTDDESPS